MSKLTINFDGTSKKVEYGAKYSNGIFLVLENKQVKRNCKILKIDLGEDTSELDLKQKVTKLGKTGILTTRSGNEYFQYIFKDYAEKKDLDSLLEEVSAKDHQALIAAFNYTRMHTMDDFEFLGGPLDNNN